MRILDASCASNLELLGRLGLWSEHSASSSCPLGRDADGARVEEIGDMRDG